MTNKEYPCRLPQRMNNSALNDEIEKDVLPWLRLAEDLRVLQLDVEVIFEAFCSIRHWVVNRPFFSLYS